MKSLVIRFTLAATLVVPAWAQDTAELSGTVHDASGAVIPGAAVRIVSKDSGLTRTSNVNEAGLYNFPGLRPGLYDVDVTATGFKKFVRTDLKLDVGQRARLVFTLEVGNIEEAITVTDEAVQTTGASTGGVIDNRQLVELPINGRDYARFSLLMPGAVARSNYISDLSFNGLHTVHNQFSIDGVDATRVDQPYMSNGYERGARLLTGSLDTISEFRVQTSTYAAEYGRSAGSNINIVSKSGTNAIHGSLYEFFRNSALDARNYFAPRNTKPKFRFNDFGGNIGGPILKNRTFYFVNYEGSRQRIGISGGGTVPSDALRQQVIATSPALAPIVNMYPHGTSSTANPRVDNYVTAQVSQVREDTGSVKVDHRFSDHDSVFVRVNVNDSHTFGPLFGVTTTALGVLDFQNVPIRTSNVAVHEQHIFTPSLIGEVLAGAQRWGSHLIANVPYPQTTVTGFTAVPGDRGRSIQNATSYQLGGNMTWIKRAHTIKWGVNAYDVWVSRLSKNTSSMTFTSIDNFVNNVVSQANFTAGDPGHTTKATQIGLFLQDTFKILPTLTFDYGLRYDYETVIHDKRDSTRTYDIRLGALAPPGSPYYRPNKNDWGPRFAIAWQPTSTTVIRSGYGIFRQAYPVGFGSYSIPVNDLPGNTTLTLQSIPNLSYPTVNFISQGTAPVPSAAGFDWTRRDIYTQQWNFSVARQISGATAVQVAYIGNRGLNLRRGYTINFFDPALGRRPNTAFSNISIEGNTGQSTYNGLQVSVNRKLSHGLVVRGEYTYSHAIDDVQDQGLFSSQPQDNNNFRAERGNGSGDIRHNFAYSLLYEIPMGRGHRLFGDQQGVVGALASGWSVASLGLIHTGIPVTVFIGTNTFGNGNFTNQRPNAVLGVDPIPTNQSITNWLTPAAFSMPAAGTFGNLGRNTVYGPGFANVDFSLLKTTPLGESRNLEFRAEFFNIPNHPNFAQPNTTFGTASFGKIFQTFGATLGLGTSRQVQLAMKFNF